MRYREIYKAQNFAFNAGGLTAINSIILEVTNARKLLPHGQNFGLGCSKSGYNPLIIQN